jgi:hypothetical protein
MTYAQNLADSAQTLPAGIGGAGLMFRNRIINGDMRIDQRNAGASVTLTSASWTYTVDRWAAFVSGSTSTVTVQRVSSGVSNFPYVMRILRGSGTFTGSTPFMQEIETLNCQDLAGQTVTVSFWARKGSAASQVSFYLQGISGSGTDQGIVGANGGTWTNWAAPVLGTPALTTTLTQYSYTWTVPAGTNEMALYFNISTYTGTGSANDYIDITGVQLEVGSTATQFERRSYGLELALCQRYFQIYGGTGQSGMPWATPQVSGTGGSSAYVPFPVLMRGAPSLVVVGSGFYAQDNSLGPVSSTVSLNTSSAIGARLSYSHSAGLTNNAARVLYFSDSTSYLQFSSEL